MNETKYWLNGRMFGAVPTTSTNSPKSTKYWFNGMPYLDIWDSPSTPPSPSTSTFMFWFTF